MLHGHMGVTVQSSLVLPFLFDLQLHNVKTTHRKSWPGTLCKVLTLTLDPCFKVKWGHTSPLLLVPDLQNVKTTYGKP